MFWWFDVTNKKKLKNPKFMVDHLSNVILLWAASSSSSSLIEGEVPVTTLLFADKYSTGLEIKYKKFREEKEPLKAFVFSVLKFRG